MMTLKHTLIPRISLVDGLELDILSLRFCINSEYILLIALTRAGEKDQGRI